MWLLHACIASIKHALFCGCEETNFPQTKYVSLCSVPDSRSDFQITWGENFTYKSELKMLIEDFSISTSSSTLMKQNNIHNLYLLIMLFRFAVLLVLATLATAFVSKGGFVRR
jgi:hypothetical protein